ncbi:uncharacterized protein F5891DRAFT_1256603 [Suillus fuscotomentosus]|uniref:FAD-binding domain-containing protein n=1 Tax=Suillus fuscotomentosus TaxID=1912939 RepID=A0AAD4HDW9_9AGAM|nr:uncharacterized protein F5891DRAFT_1256603 [Suillus fuscotomentosus]KAG1894030.1 hypothetical protein F5891DRAFT_1256603 [Suillus fuscotomentosus]
MVSTTRLRANLVQLIIDAGPVGLVAALTLFQNGISVCIINKDPHPRIGQCGTGMWPRSHELYNFLGISEVISLAKPAPLIRFYKPRTLESLKDNGHRSMGQQLLDVILQHHLEKFSCYVKISTKLRSFEQSDEGVTVVLAKNGISETFDTKWIIGADGTKSIVRKQLGLTFLGETRDDAQVVTGDICLTDVGLERLLVWMSYFKPSNIWMVNKFSKGRVLVAGMSIAQWVVRDSIQAYKMHNMTSRPLDSQHEDGSLRSSKGLANKSLLETYSAERLPVISEMLGVTTSILNKTMASKEPQIEQNSILFMLGINCRFSTIVLDEFVTSVTKPINTYGVLDEGHLEAGDRVPDAPNMLQVGRTEPGTTTLFSLYRPWYHTILVFALGLADATLILGALETYNKIMSVVSPADLVLIDQEGHAYSAYLMEAGQTKVFVIRPDRVVGALVHGTEGVKKYSSGKYIGWWPEYSFFTYDF